MARKRKIDSLTSPCGRLPSMVTKCKKREKNSLQKKRARLEKHHLPPPPIVPYIPENVIFSKILPLLSFDNLARLKSVCKSWCSFISSNPMLPFDRFPRRHHISSPSSLSNYDYSGLLFTECDSNGQLVFLPTSRGAPGRPDFLSVSFSQQPLSCKELVASTDGLLCLKCNANDNIVFVCNPLTKEGHIVPLSNSWHDTPDNNHFYVWRSSIGLAYDSLKSPDRYMLVCPWSHYLEEGDRVRLVFGFEVFSSQTNTWDKSCNKYYTEERRDYLGDIPQDDFSTNKSVYAGGVLYWDYTIRLMYFDPEKGYGGVVPLPFDYFEYEEDDHRIGGFEGRVTCSRVSRRKGIQLWILQDVNRGSSGCWELMHQVRFETVIRTNRYDLRTAAMPLRNRKDVKIMFQGYGVITLPYDDSGRLFMRVPFLRKIRDNVLCYDLNSGKLNKVCTLLSASYHYMVNNRHSFLYRSSMVSLPKLGKPSNHKL